MKLEPVGIVQALSVAGTPMPNSTGVEWLKEVPVGAKLYAIPDGYVVVPLTDEIAAAMLAAKEQS